MSGALPASIDPVRLADQGAHLSGTIPLNRMKRLLTACRSGEGDVRVDLEFRHDPIRHRRLVQGRIQANVITTCERCLEAVTLPVEANVNLVLLTADEDNAAAAEAYTEEPEDVLMVDEQIGLSELVENELILAMPMIPMHSRNQCPATGVTESRGHEQDRKPDGGGKPSPFAELVKLKRSDR